jgi:hypothetical protein
MKLHSNNELRKVKDALGSMDFGTEVFKLVSDELKCREKAEGHVEEVDAYKCTHCNTLHEDKDDAIDCCNSVEEFIAYKCTKCDTLHEDEDEAKTCCDW